MGSRPQREFRHDHVLEDVIEIGLIYWEVFGTAAATQYLLTCRVDERIVERVFHGMRRRGDLLA